MYYQVRDAANMPLAYCLTLPDAELVAAQHAGATVLAQPISVLSIDYAQVTWLDYTNQWATRPQINRYTTYPAK
jgi:hypothetical protein